MGHQYSPHNAEHQESNFLHINAFGMAQPEFEPTTSRFFSGCSNPQPPGQVLNLEGFCLELNEADL